tara:strand:+ start:47 stop:979 length:933 start_codon:yes stop_codon:yes gene_type:complete
MKRISLLPILIIILFFSCEKPSNDCHLLSNSSEVDTSKLSRKVLVLGLDGVRSDAMNENNSPFMFALSATDGVYFTASHSVESITYSGPNWSSILTGVHYAKHGVTSNDFEHPNFACYPTFFDYVEAVDSSIHTASIVNWTPINTHILSSSTDFSPQASVQDLEVYENVQTLLINDSPFNADVIFVHFDELDAAGHAFGFSSDVPEYSSTLNTLDTYVENLFNTINTKRLAGEDWLIMVVSDHGGDGTGHGDAQNPYINQTIFFAQHPSLVFKNQYTSSQADLAPTILDFLGISNPNFDCQTDGVSLFEE